MKINKLLKELDEKSRKKYENDIYIEKMKSDVVVKANLMQKMKCLNHRHLTK